MFGVKISGCERLLNKIRFPMLSVHVVSAVVFAIREFIDHEAKGASLELRFTGVEGCTRLMAAVDVEVVVVFIETSLADVAL